MQSIVEKRAAVTYDCGMVLPRSPLLRLALVAATAAATAACASAPRPRVFELDQVDERPTLKRQRATPRYPTAAREQGITGSVKLRVRIDQRGRVREVRVLKARPPGVFEQAAVEAIRRWRFEPARYKGEAVRVWIEQTIHFRLD